ncbi:hypothetical protein T01_10936 [Trichinella spiralis]|uniref:Uncharacterized protein n=1 Tax=Trichinella spiralis TaxID=6334 RepID=A0A0V1AR64_TRISP|nr:hypothetical protein T01_10936 [Trichinella spiralis]
MQICELVVRRYWWLGELFSAFSGTSAIRTVDLFNKWPIRRRFWKKTVLEKLATVYKSGWIITVNDEGHWQLNFRGQCRSTRFLIGPSIRRLIGFPYLIAH